MKILTILLILLSFGCSNENSKSKPALKNDSSYLQLTYGYSFIYKQLGALIISEKVLLIRNETDQVRKYAEEIAEFAKKLKKDLESVSKSQKKIRLDDTGQSQAEKAMFDAISKDMAINYLPTIGFDLKIFERQYLLNSVGLLSQIHFMFGAIMELETSSSRKKSLQQVYDQALVLRIKGQKILNSHYYKHNQFK